MKSKRPKTFAGTDIPSDIFRPLRRIKRLRGPIVIDPSGGWTINGVSLSAGDTIEVSMGKCRVRGQVVTNGVELILNADGDLFRTAVVEGLLAKRISP